MKNSAASMHSDDTSRASPFVKPVYGPSDTLGQNFVAANMRANNQAHNIQASGLGKPQRRFTVLPPKSTEGRVDASSGAAPENNTGRGSAGLQAFAGDDGFNIGGERPTRGKGGSHRHELQHPLVPGGPIYSASRDAGGRGGLSAAEMMRAAQMSGWGPSELELHSRGGLLAPRGFASSGDAEFSDMKFNFAAYSEPQAWSMPHAFRCPHECMDGWHGVAPPGSACSCGAHLADGHHHGRSHAFGCAIHGPRDVLFGASGTMTDPDAVPHAAPDTETIPDDEHHAVPEEHVNPVTGSATRRRHLHHHNHHHHHHHHGLDSAHRTPQSAQKNRRNRRYNFRPVHKLFESPAKKMASPNKSTGCSVQATPQPNKIVSFSGTPATALGASPFVRSSPALGGSLATRRLIVDSDDEGDRHDGVAVRGRAQPTETKRNSKKNAQKIQHEPIMTMNKRREDRKTSPLEQRNETQRFRERTTNAPSTASVVTSDLTLTREENAEKRPTVFAALVREQRTDRVPTGGRSAHQPQERRAVPAATESLSRVYVEVEGHHGQRRQLVGNADSVTAGDYVLHEGDRGEDIGRVVQISTRPPEGVSSTPAAPPARAGRGRSNDASQPPSIIRRATAEEIAFWSGQLLEESTEASETCSQLVTRLDLPLLIISASFQFDRKKLTIFYETSEHRVDFRRLLMDMYNLYRCRIWMERVE